jgi:hypothetical protein
MKTLKLWVVDERGRFVPGLGLRNYGEHFVCDTDTYNSLVKVSGFSATDPLKSGKPKPKPQDEIIVAGKANKESE